MNSKGIQIAAGLLLGGLASGAVWYFLAPQRESLAALTESNSELEAQVTQTKQLKDNYEKLKKEVTEQEARIAEMVRQLPQEGERAKINQMIQKLAQNAGLGRMQESRANDRPSKGLYYLEYETLYRYLGGYHDFGRFLSYVSGFEKLVNISDISVSRSSSGTTSSAASIDFKLSVFVHDQSADQATMSVAGAPKHGEGQP